MPGSRGEFDRSLEAIEAKVIELFAMIAEDLPRAAESLQGSGHGETARVLAEREQLIDTLYLEVEQLASREVLLQAPVASDLRFLLSVLRVTPELERSHDLVIQAASHAGLAAGDLTPRSRELARQMAALASQMWRQAADSWYSRDRTAATALAGPAQEMDALHASLAAELASGQMTAPVTMEMTLVARCYQRLGAHAVNITRRVAYLAGPTAR
jgi:phosphate transport system protein